MISIPVTQLVSPIYYPPQVLVLNYLNNALLITLRMWLLIWQGNGSHEPDVSCDVTTLLRKLSSGEMKLPSREMGWFDSKGIVDQ